MGTSSSTDLPVNVPELEQWINSRENRTVSLKPDARAQIKWADPQKKQKTRYSLVYLHGFKASHGEGFPVHKNVACRLNCNLYLARLRKHGLNDPNAFKNLQCSDLISSAAEAFEIGRRLGEKVIIMGTSTGASLALYLAGIDRLRPEVATLLLYSPLVEFHGLQSLLLSTNTGRKILKFLAKSNYKISSGNKSGKEAEIWYSSYHIQGIIALGQFVENFMNRDAFQQVNTPVLTAYFYKNIFQQDKVVSVSALKKMHQALSTSDNKKKLLRLTDAHTHVIASELFSNSIEKLETETVNFLRNHLPFNNL